MSSRTIIRRYVMHPAIELIDECVYCGDPAEVIDHVLPVRYSNWRDQLTPEERDQLVLVPSCAECNALAAARAFFSLVEKRNYIRKRLEKRYADDLKRTMWGQEEISELGPGLRGFVEGAQARARLARLRISHEGLPPEIKDHAPVTDVQLECSVCGELDWCQSVTSDNEAHYLCQACLSAE